MAKWWVGLLVLIQMSAYANNFYDQSAMGWHWYQDPVKKAKPLIAPTLEQEKAQLKQALDQAVMHPTPDNVRNYIVLQNAWSQRSSQFASVWQSVLLNDPQLNYSLSHPVSQLGSQVYSDQKQQAEQKAIAVLAQHSGLFFFYRSTCPYCQRFAPILKAFSEQYHIAVIPITTNGVALPEFPNSRIDQGQAAQFHITVEPAVFGINPYTHKAVPVSYGLVTEDDLKQRILDIVGKL